MYSNSILSPSNIKMNLSTIQFVIYSHPLTKSEPKHPCLINFCPIGKSIKHLSTLPNFLCRP